MGSCMNGNAVRKKGWQSLNSRIPAGDDLIDIFTATTTLSCKFVSSVPGYGKKVIIHDGKDLVMVQTNTLWRYHI